MTRVAFARAISIVGHPVVLVLAASLIVAAARGASVRQLCLVGGGVGLVGALVLGFSWLQVRKRRWRHVDASARDERVSLNVFLAGLLLASALLLWNATHRPAMPTALALSGALAVAALLAGRWVKTSLHTAFATFATVLAWPIKLAVIAGLLMTIAVAWSRLVLGRHVVADIVAGVLLGAAAGGAYHALTFQ